MKKLSKWNRVIAVVLTASLFIPEMAADVFAYSSVNIVKEENELQMDMDLETEEETEPEETEKILITSQPEDITIAEGEIYVFRVAAEGNGLTYLWQFSLDGGANWYDTGRKSNSYPRHAYMSESGRMFRCVITDAEGNTVISNAAKLTITKAFSITSQPKNLTVTEGETFAFDVSAAGSGLTYLWQSSFDNGTTWSDTDCAESSYTGTASYDMNGRMFRCVIADAEGNTVASNAAALTVNKSVAITSQPADVIVYSGNTFTFSIAAEGTDLTYLWQYSTDNGSTWSNTACMDDSYSGIAASNMSGNLFRCIVTDGAGNTAVSDTAVLIVNRQTSITSQPTDVTVYSGNTFTFSVAAEGTDLTYLWQYSTDGGSIWSNTTCTDDSYIGIAAANLDGHMFRCIVTDSDGYSVISNAASLSVTTSSIVITSQPEDLTVHVGDIYIFKVAAEGTGLTYLWQFSRDGGTTWYNTNRTANNYPCHAYLSENGRMFRCVITDAEGNTVISNAAKLTITNTFSITSQPENSTVYEGDTFTFNVSADGIGMTYLWQSSSDQGASWNNTSCTESSYTGTAAFDMNGRLFRCVVTDEDGNTVTSNTASLTINKKVSITSQPEDAIVNSGNLFTFAVAAEGKDLTYLWQYSTDEGTSWSSTSCTKNTYTGITAASMSGHMYRCVVTDGAGNTVISNAALLTVTASSIVITSQPEDLTVLVGEIYVIKVAAEGNGLTYLWQFSRDGGTTWYNTNRAANNYPCHAYLSESGRMFRCVITDADGNTVISDAATLTVISE